MAKKRSAPKKSVAPKKSAAPKKEDTKKETENGDKVNWNQMVNDIHEITGTDTAVVNKYGMVLASRLKAFGKGRLISPLIWSIIDQRVKLADELEVTEISSLVVETDKGNMVFTFGKYIYLMSIIKKSVNLAEFLPVIGKLIKTLDKSTETDVEIAFEYLELEKEFEILGRKESKSDIKKRFEIFPHLIKHMSSKKK